MNIDKFIGWRKIGFAIALTLISTVGWLVMGMLDFDQWSGFQEWIYSAYAVTNIGERFTDKMKTKNPQIK